MVKVDRHVKGEAPAMVATAQIVQTARNGLNS